jgi:hypothetical protein
MTRQGTRRLVWTFAGTDGNEFDDLFASSTTPKRNTCVNNKENINHFRLFNNTVCSEKVI